MFELTRFRLLFKKYKTIFSDILGNMQVEKIEASKITFKDKNGQIMTAVVDGNTIKFEYNNNEIQKWITVNLPKSGTPSTYVAVFEIIKEKRPVGCIVEKITKIYDFSEESPKDRILVNLISKRYVLGKDVNYANMEQDKFDIFLNQISLMKTEFKSHVNRVVKASDGNYYSEFIYKTRVTLNGNDISHIYATVNGNDRILRIYDLYNGIINERNGNDIFSIHLGLLDQKSLGYKETSGINESEIALCGHPISDIPYNQDYEFIHKLIQGKIGYKKPFSCVDLNSLLEAITHKGSGEHSAFVEAGESSDNHRKRFEI